MPAEWKLSPHVGVRSPASSASSLGPRGFDGRGDEPAATASAAVSGS